MCVCVCVCMLLCVVKHCSPKSSLRRSNIVSENSYRKDLHLCFFSFHEFPHPFPCIRKSSPPCEHALLSTLTTTLSQTFIANTRSPRKFRGSQQTADSGRVGAHTPSGKSPGASPHLLYASSYFSPPFSTPLFKNVFASSPFFGSLSLYTSIPHIYFREESWPTYELTVCMSNA
jgi:hypothetical protein